MGKPLIGFDAAAHAYEIDGVSVPSVTQIIGESGLVDDRWFTEAARDRGTAVHKAVEAINNRTLNRTIQCMQVDPEITPYLSAYQDFRRQSGMRVYKSEMRICSKRHGYAGTLDIYAVMKGHLRAVIDIKTGIVPETVGLQTAAYYGALIEMKYQPNARFSLQLKKNGTYVLREIRAKYSYDFGIFLELLKQRNERAKRNGNNHPKY